ncbi:MAG: SGNH/GDSL hydrolase family protein [Eubacteriales bacterium]|nr:SGNH/GDSL hydrolase family protein [Eubacteriales bacterium]
MDINNYFDRYVSNTIAGTSNQSYFDSPQKKTSYAFYRVSKHGKMPYSFFFSNTVDSTYADGSISKCNDLCGNWTIYKMSVCTPRNIYDIFIGASKEILLTVDGKSEKTVLPGEEFCTDEVLLDVGEAEYICVKMTFSGHKIPCHIENTIPTFSRTEDGAEIKCDKYIPLPSMVGVRRNVLGRIAFIGDSITQGIGCPENSYDNYTAVCARELKDSYSFWNLGIGYARGADFASNGAWARKAEKCDVAVVCFGVNDIFQVANAQKTMKDFDDIVNILSGKKIIFQTVPPFNYDESARKIWCALNEYIDSEIRGRVFAVFDNNKYLSDEKNPQRALFGGHPNAVGAGIWGHNLAAFLKDKI